MKHLIDHADSLLLIFDVIAVTNVEFFRVYLTVSIVLLDFVANDQYVILIEVFVITNFVIRVQDMDLFQLNRHVSFDEFDYVPDETVDNGGKMIIHGEDLNVDVAKFECNVAQVDSLMMKDPVMMDKDHW